MKLAFSQATTTPAATDYLRRAFRRHGYDGLQLKGNQYLPYLDEPERFRDEWPEAGVASALIAGGRLVADDLARLERIVAFARAVGSERIVFCHSQPRQGLTADDLRGFACELSTLAARIADQGLALSLHHHHNQPVMHRDDFDRFFSTAKGVGLTIDTAHLAKSGITDIAKLIRDFAPVIDNYHLKDFADGQWRVLGEGSIDFAPIWAAIAATGHRGWVSADEESGAEPGIAMPLIAARMTAGLRHDALVQRGADAPHETMAWGALSWLVSGTTPAAGMTVGRVVFAPGQANPPHFHPNCDEVLHVLSGTLEHSLPQGGTVLLGPGDSVCLPRGRPHHARNPGTVPAEAVICFNADRRLTVGETSEARAE